MLRAAAAVLLLAGPLKAAPTPAELPKDFPAAALIKRSCGDARPARPPVEVALGSAEGAAVIHSLAAKKPGAVALLRPPEAESRPKPGSVSRIWRVASGGGVGSHDNKAADFKGQTNSYMYHSLCHAALTANGWRFVRITRKDEWGEEPRFTPSGAPAAP